VGTIARAFDTLLGRGEAAVTVPALDGVLRPNRRLDEAARRLPLDDVVGLAVQDGRLLAAAGQEVMALEPSGQWQGRFAFETPISCIAALPDGGLAVALADGIVVIRGGARDGRHFSLGGLACITAMAASGDALFVANGSASNAAAAWQRDLMQRNASGSLWRIGLDGGAPVRLAGDLAFPAGLAVDGATLVVAEAWRHRLIRLDPARARARQPLCVDLPGYPGQLARSGEGFWLAVFAPRSQLVEFVLREPGYRRRMIAELPEQHWIAPKLRSGRSFYEPLQGGGVKHLGLLKPWAPTLSAGLCVRLDAAFQPIESLHSRADGAAHGVVSVVESDGAIYAAARGDNVVVAVPREEGT